MNKKENIQRIQSGLKETAKLLECLVDEIPEDRLQYEFASGIWNISENILHLIDTEKLFQYRLNLFLKSEHPVIQGYVPDENSSEQISNPGIHKSIIKFARLRDETLKLLESIPDEVLQRQGQHSEQNSPLSFVRLNQHFLSHDHYHLYRIEELGFNKIDNIQPF